MHLVGVVDVVVAFGYVKCPRDAANLTRSATSLRRLMACAQNNIGALAHSLVLPAARSDTNATSCRPPFGIVGVVACVRVSGCVFV